jgi:hypothetical protein
MVKATKWDEEDDTTLTKEQLATKLECMVQWVADLDEKKQEEPKTKDKDEEPPSQQQHMGLYVTMLSGETYPIDVDPRDNIWELKGKIKDKLNIRRYSQVLTFGETVLENDHLALEDYKIPEGATISLTIVQVDVVRIVEED